MEDMEAFFIIMQVIGLIGFIIFLIIIWFLPVLIAKKRQIDDIGIVKILSFLGVFLGITWIVALCMACFKDKNKNKN